MTLSVTVACCPPGPSASRSRSSAATTCQPRSVTSAINLYRRLLDLEFQNRLCDDDGVIKAGGPSLTPSLDGIEVSGVEAEARQRRSGTAARDLPAKGPRATVPGTGPDTRPDLVQRAFTADQPDHLWVADITYVRTFAGWVYGTALPQVVLDKQTVKQYHQGGSAGAGSRCRARSAFAVRRRVRRRVAGTARQGWVGNARPWGAVTARVTRPRSWRPRSTPFIDCRVTNTLRASSEFSPGCCPSTSRHA